MKTTQFSAKCRYCIPIHQGAPRYEKYTIFSRCRYCITIHLGALSRAALGVSKAFLFYSSYVHTADHINSTIQIAQARRALLIKLFTRLVPDRVRSYIELA